jgi:ribosomal protein L7Ae-like RNA K-turn-binding protein
MARAEGMARAEVNADAEGSAVCNVLPDLAASAFGRGAWLHPHVKCMKNAQRGLSRSFKTAVSADSGELARRLAQAADRRVEALLSAARRSRKVAIGSTLVRQELERDRCRLVVVATDARAAATTPWVQQAVSRGLAAAWGTKERLGRVMGRSEVGVVALVDDGLARTLTRSIGLAHLNSPCLVPGDVDGEVSTEVG